MGCLQFIPNAGNVRANCSATFTARPYNFVEVVSLATARPNFYFTLEVIVALRGELNANSRLIPVPRLVIGLRANPEAVATLWPRLTKIIELEAFLAAQTTLLARLSKIIGLRAILVADTQFNPFVTVITILGNAAYPATRFYAQTTFTPQLTVATEQVVQFSCVATFTANTGLVHGFAPTTLSCASTVYSALTVIKTVPRNSVNFAALATLTVAVDSFETTTYGLIAPLMRARSSFFCQARTLAAPSLPGPTDNSRGAGPDPEPEQPPTDERDNELFNLKRFPLAQMSSVRKNTSESAFGAKDIRWTMSAYLTFPGGPLTEIVLPATPSYPQYRKAFRAVPSLRPPSTRFNPDWMWRYATQPAGSREPCNCEVIHLCFFTVNSGEWRVGQEREVMLVLPDPIFGLPYPRYAPNNLYRQVTVKNIAYNIPATQLLRNRSAEGASPCGYARSPQYYEMGQIGIVLEDCGPSYWLVNAECNSM